MLGSDAVAASGRRLEEENNRLVVMGKQHNLTATQASLLQEEVSKLRAKISEETSARIKLETELSVLKIDFEHTAKRAEVSEARYKGAEAREQACAHILRLYALTRPQQSLAQGQSTMLPGINMFPSMSMSNPYMPSYSSFSGYPGCARQLC